MESAPPPAVPAESLAPYETLEMWPPGKMLFREGVVPEGIYFLHSGEVDLSVAARNGDAKPLLLAGSGQILGLTCVMSGRPHDCSAVTRTACTTGFVEKDRFLQLLDERPALWLAVLRMISTDINACWDCMRQLSAGR
jgi:CRP/FNR family transcriptional regulator, polysaccharide utilization system transcription regulator